MDISVVICTRNRANSLRQTLQCLAEADRSDIDAEVVVVDNGSTDNTKETVDSMNGFLPIRYLLEPEPGKSHGLNRALDEGEFGEIVAFLDDDMSPQKEWFKGVLAIARRWPDHDVFTGRSYIIWPDVELPSWAHSGLVRGRAFSVVDLGEKDVLLDKRIWPSGNHYWIRSRVLHKGLRFYPFWEEAAFTSRLVGEGLNAVSGPDAVVGHRIQQQLLDKRVQLKRAMRLGRELPYVRLRFPRVFSQARLLRDHPILWRFAYAASLLRWIGRLVAAQCHFSGDERFVRTFDHLTGLMNSWETLRRGHLIWEEHMRKSLASARESASIDSNI